MDAEYVADRSQGCQSDVTIRTRNHYAAQGYLKRWASDGKKLWTYRTVVSRERVSPWELQSVKSVARLDHLYTQFLRGNPDDSVERWLDTTVDGPSAVVLDKVAAEKRLTVGDYDTLVRFFAASHARTPGFMIRNRPQWEHEIPRLLQSTLERPPLFPGKEGLTQPRNREGFPPIELASPFRVRVRPNVSGEGGVVEAQAVVGRSLWLHHVVGWVQMADRHLRRAPWSVRRAPEGTRWFTSDDPAVIASVSRDRRVSTGRFVAGQKTFAFIALDPIHLLCASFGQDAAGRYSVMDADGTEFVQRCLVMNAHRRIFSSRADEWVSDVRPRVVDASLVASDARVWESWPTEQQLAEVALEDDGTWPDAVIGEPPPDS